VQHGVTCCVLDDSKRRPGEKNMQWLIDMIQEWVKLYFKGVIVMWHGAWDDIPDGWALCDGTNGTPNLQNRFVTHAPIEPLMNTTGGSTGHKHEFTADIHRHDLAEGALVAAGANFDNKTKFDPVTGETNIKSHYPPYYFLAFIMKL